MKEEMNRRNSCESRFVTIFKTLEFVSTESYQVLPAIKDALRRIKAYNVYKRCMIWINIQRKLLASVMVLMVTIFSCNALYAMGTPKQAPAITGEPFIDSPKILDWPTDGGYQEPSLAEPTANLANDLHAEIDQCDMVLTTAGNYHMALKELWDLYLAKFRPDEPLRNWFYTTSPPIAKQQITNGLVQLGNVRAHCRPQIAVGPKGLIDSIVGAGFGVGDAVPISKTRGNVLLVRKGNPKHIGTIWDLGRHDVRVVTPNPSSEAGSFNLYANTIYDIAGNDQEPPPDSTAKGLFNAIFNSTDKDPQKWLSGKRIHHREIPWSVAYGKADAAVIFYHLALYTVTMFRDLFDIVPLGGSSGKPEPLPGNHTEVLYAIRIRGNWTEKQRNASDKLMELFQSQEFTSILAKYGLDRP